MFATSALAQYGCAMWVSNVVRNNERAMSAAAWNHNIHYHGVIVAAVPPDCELALDVGCGEGILARRLTRHCRAVVAIDIDHDCLARARASEHSQSGVTFVEADVMDYPFSDSSFDLITAIATVHHLSLQPALERFRALLRPGGVLAIIGLYRPATAGDYLLSAAALPMSWIFRCTRHYTQVTAPTREPTETLSEIRKVCETVLPGADLRRRLLFRYSLIWDKPSFTSPEPDS